MKAQALKTFRDKLQQNQPVFGLWITLESPSITEMAVALGLDWVVLDAEHGHLDWKELIEHLRATVRSDTVALVRIAELQQGLVKRALDIGADGVVVPWMESADQLRQAVRYATYPPGGIRGIGAERATCWGQCFVEHVAEADENVLVVPIIESVTGAQHIDEMLRVDGAEMFFFGPADFSATAGYAGQWEGPQVSEQIREAANRIRNAGKHCGVVTAGASDMAARQAQGFRMLGLGLDAGLLLRSLKGALAEVGQDRAIQPGFVLERTPIDQVQPIACAPATMRPDRDERMNDPGAGPQLEIAPGVGFDCMVGSHNQARDLTTGLVTLAPGAQLPYHRHAFGESITLLTGQAVVEVEGRRYTVSQLDNVTVPKPLAHTVTNLSREQPAVFHVAMASDQPERELVRKFFSRRAMPDTSAGLPGAERVTRYRTAERYEPGDNASFIDFFNAELMPDIEMSGGYGLFQPGGRLPAHLHDFDESIYIADGDATCIVEGRRYQMHAGSTALQPRGRIHYFINESAGPMAMIWVYAGPLPQRLIVDERCASESGTAWA